MFGPKRFILSPALADSRNCTKDVRVSSSGLAVPTVHSAQNLSIFASTYVGVGDPVKKYFSGETSRKLISHCADLPEKFVKFRDREICFRILLFFQRTRNNFRLALHAPSNLKAVHT
jgi:hypothetical protein